MKTVLLLLFFLTISNNIFCQKIQVLTLENSRPFYYENNEFRVTDFDSTIMITQEINYIPGIPDSNRNYLTLDLIINSPLKAINKKKIDVIKDTSILKSDFSLNSSDYDMKRDLISGNIIIQSWNKYRISLILNVKVFDSISGRTYIYSGIRSFKRSKRGFGKATSHDYDG